MDHKVHIYQHQALFIFYSPILPTKIICLCDQGTMWWESVLLTMESTTFPSGKWTWILSAGTLYRYKAAVVTDTILVVLGRYLMVINSSINIIIYCWGGKQFKAVLLSMICCRRIEDQQVGDQTATNQHSKLDTNSNLQFPSSTNSQQQRKDTNGISCVTQSTRANGEVQRTHMIQNTPGLVGAFFCS